MKVMIKQFGLYFTIVTATVGITYPAVKYLISKEIVDDKQSSAIDTIYVHLRLNEQLSKQVLVKVSVIDSIKQDQKQLRQDIKVLANTFEHHILKDSKITRDVLDELRRLYPIMNYSGLHDNNYYTFKRQ
jgi:hypothetical protein